MDHVRLLKEYERRLGYHSWDAVADLIHEDAVFIFSEGTFRGKEEIAQAFKQTFATIQDEHYTVRNVDWLVVSETIAVCIYEFRWSGTIDGQPASGGGRGTSVLCRTTDGWEIIHEHLGPMGR